MYANLGVQPGEIHWYYYPGIVGHYLAFFFGVFFFGIRLHAWMTKTDLKPYAEFKETLTSGKKSGNFKMAVREIEEFVAGEDSVESEV